MLLKLTVVLITVSVFCIGPVKSHSQCEATTLGDIADMRTALSDMKKQLQAAEERINTTKMELVNLDRDHTWQALHMAAAGACRGSTRTGGHGTWGNVVLPKENTRSCDDICGATKFNVCDAEVALIGYPGKAKDYTTTVGSFYNYGCTKAGNPNVPFDEVKAPQDGIFQRRVYYYRFCCCRLA